MATNARSCPARASTTSRSSDCDRRNRSESHGLMPPQTPRRGTAFPLTKEDLPAKPATSWTEPSSDVVAEYINWAAGLLLGRDPRPSGGQEIADLVTGVHES